MDANKKPRPVIAAAVTIIILAGLTAVIVYFTNQPNNNPAKTPSSSENRPDTSSAENDGEYTDGSYEAEGKYSTPGGTDAIVLKVTLEKGIIVATELEQHPTSGNAKQFQSQFAGGYKELVVGKDIDEVRLSRVAGSSLTSNGFNSALEKIKEEARAGS